MLTEKDYCDLDTSHELWQMGLEPDTYYDGPHILLYEAQKLLREEKGLFIEISIFLGKYNLNICNTKVECDKTHKILCEICGFETYEEALSEGIKEAVKILKENETIHE